MQRPAEDEYADYYRLYVSKVPDGDVCDTLTAQLAETRRLLAVFGEEGGNHRYAPDKWSVKQVVGHVIDVERVFAVRCLAFARGDETPWPGIDQDVYMRAVDFDRRSLAGLSEELSAVRAASLALFHGIEEEAWTRRGSASGNRFSARSMPWIMAGHERHHVGVLRDRYR
jgi:hypothetical protein